MLKRHEQDSLGMRDKGRVTILGLDITPMKEFEANKEGYGLIVCRKCYAKVFVHTRPT